MSYPNAPEIQTSYTSVEQALGDGTLPGQELDTDLASIRASITAVIEFLKTSLRSDGRLANGSVSSDTLASSLIIGFDPPQVWATGTSYTTSSTVFEGFGFYLCVQAHTSGTFASDLASGRWALLADLTPPGGALIAANNLSDLPDKAAARSNLQLGTMATANSGTGASQHRTNLQNEAFFQPLDAELTALAGLTSAANKLPYFTGSGTAALADLTTAGRALLDDADAAAQRTTLGAQASNATLTSLSGISLVAGDILVATGPNTLVRLGAGPNGSFLSPVSGVPAWGGAFAYTDVTGSRSSNTDYTNSSGRNRVVTIVLSSSSNTATADMQIGGVDVARFLNGAGGTTQRNSMTVIVPVGAVYRLSVSGTLTINKWSEGDL
jgi:hypothetical protein